MPDITVRNDTTSCLNIAFCVVTPLAYANEVGPGDTIRLHCGAFPHTVEVRYDLGDNQFSAKESWQKVGEIWGACVAGATAVCLGAAGSLISPNVPLRAVALAGAGAAWEVAHKGGALYSQDANGVVLRVQGVWVPFYEKHYAIRMEDTGFFLWDISDNCALRSKRVLVDCVVQILRS